MTDVKAKKTTQYLAVLNESMLEGVVSEMNRRGVESLELLKGMIMIVSRPEPNGAAVQ